MLTSLSLVALLMVPVAASASDTFYGWYLKKSLPADFRHYGYTVVSKEDGHPVRSGDESMRFEVRAGDCSQKDCHRDRERHELKSEATWYSGEEWYHWSLYLPKDYPNIYPVKVALGQFHQERGPVMWMFQNGPGGYWVDNQTIGSTLEKRRVLTDEEMRGRWTDVLVHARWTHEDDGFFRVYINGRTEPVYDWKGPTKEEGLEVYYKVGIYRSFMTRRPGPEPTQVVYYDDVNRGRSCPRVTKHFDCEKITAAP